MSRCVWVLTIKGCGATYVILTTHFSGMTTHFSGASNPKLLHPDTFFFFVGSHLSQRHPLRIVLGPEGNDDG